MWRNKWLLTTVVVAGLMCLIGLSFFSFSQRDVDFNTAIRPILNSSCLGCHGGVKRQGGLSLLFREEALSDKTDSGLPAIIPGDPQNSELIKRVRHHDHDERMPLEADPLTDAEILLAAGLTE